MNICCCCCYIICRGGGGGNDILIRNHRIGIPVMLVVDFIDCIHSLQYVQRIGKKKQIERMIDSSYDKIYIKTSINVL